MHTTYTLGLDPGFAKAPLGLAMLAFDSGTPSLIFTHSIRSIRGGDWQRRADEVLGELRDWLRIEVLPFYPPFLFSYELAHVQTNPQTALRLADLGGGIRGLAAMLEYPCIGVEPVQGKVALTGQAGADKQMMIDACRKFFGRALSEHEADAVGHALAGEALVRRRAIEVGR